MRRPVTHAVLTLPASTTLRVREMVYNLGLSVGFTDLRTGPAPGHASLMYALRRLPGAGGAQDVLFFDLGGGTLEVTQFSIEEGICETLAQGCDTLGGQDFEVLLLEHCIQEVKRVHMKDVNTDPLALRRMRTACANAMPALLDGNQAAVVVDALFDGIDFTFHVSQALFEQISASLLQRCMELVDKVLKDAKVEAGAVQTVVTLGGCSRMPRVQAMLSEHFGSHKMCRDFHPEEMVVRGTATLAAILSGSSVEKVHDLLLLNATTLTLGVETAGGVMNAFIQRNTTIPVRKDLVFACTEQIALIKVFGRRAQQDARQQPARKLRADGNTAVGGRRAADHHRFRNRPQATSVRHGPGRCERQQSNLAPERRRHRRRTAVW